MNDERSKDTMSRRRSRLTGVDRKAFDQYYGKPTGTRARGGAGKGDAQRPTDRTLYDLGWLISHGETPEIRAEAEAEWQRLRNVRDDKRAD